MLQDTRPCTRLSSVRDLCPPPNFSLLFSTLHSYLEWEKALSVQKGVCEFTQAALGNLHHPLGAAECTLGCCGRGAQEINRCKDQGFEKIVGGKPNYLLLLKSRAIKRDKLKIRGMFWGLEVKDSL